jgi:hypothetical protein
MYLSKQEQIHHPRQIKKNILNDLTQTHFIV